MSASRFTAQRRAFAEGALNKVQNSNTIMTTQSPYRGVLGCGPRNFTQIVQFKPKCNKDCINPGPAPTPPEPNTDLIFTVSGTVWTGSQIVAYTSIHMYVDEGDVILDQQNGMTIVFSTTV